MAGQRLKYLKLQKDMLDVLCIFPASKINGPWKSMFVFIYHSLLVLILLIRLMSEIIDIYMNISKVEIWADTASIGISTFNSILRMFVLLYKGDKLINLFFTWEKMFVHKAIIKPKAEDVRKWASTIKIYVIFVALMYATMILHWGIHPILTAYIYTETLERNLPWRAWYPESFTLSPMYEIVYFLQVIMVSIAAYLVLVCETTVVTFCILMYYLTIDLKARLTQLELLGTDMDSMEDGNEKRVKILDRELHRSIKYHRNIIRFTGQLEDVFNTMLIIGLMQSIIPLCFTALMATTDTKSFIWIEYFIACISQLFLLCFCGNLVTSQLLSVHSAASKACTSVTSQLRWKLQIMMLQSNVEQRFSGGGVLILSMGTFKKVLGLALSYFIFLRNIKDSNYA